MPLQAEWWEVVPALIGALFTFGFVVLVVVVVVAVLRGREARGRAAVPALRLLEERYARGEIDRQEFLERRRVLSGEPPGGAA